MELRDEEIEALGAQGFFTRESFLGAPQARAVHAQVRAWVDTGTLRPAGIRRGADRTEDTRVRGDFITWVVPQPGTALGALWDAFSALGEALSAGTYLGLGRFDVQLAHYPGEGASYTRHRDAFPGQSNRRVTAIYYANPDWEPGHGGQLRLYLEGRPHRAPGARGAPLPRAQARADGLVLRQGRHLTGYHAPMAGLSPPFKPGTLWSSLVERSKKALASGALVPIHTHVERVVDETIPFLVRVVSSLERKAQAAPSPKNPFLPPYEADLFVAHVAPAHACLLNKFNVFDHHALIVTRDFEPQEDLLTLADFEALLTCMAEFDALAFYNGGRLAGASQPHKHLQLVPVPLAEGEVRTPMDAAITRRWLPFRHALGPGPRSPAQAHDTYLRLLRGVGCDRPGMPYNLLATRDWMLVVPRLREGFESISLNALAFAGSLLVKNREQLERVRTIGPMSMLRDVTGTWA